MPCLPPLTGFVITECLDHPRQCLMTLHGPPCAMQSLLLVGGVPITPGSGRLFHVPVCATLAAQAGCGSPVSGADTTALGLGWCVVQAVAGCGVAVGSCLAACLPWGLFEVVDAVCASSYHCEPWSLFHSNIFRLSHVFPVCRLADPHAAVALPHDAAVT